VELRAGRIAFVATIALAPFATGAMIAAVDSSAFALFIAPEIWIAATIALAVAVRRSLDPYGSMAGAMGAIGSGVGYGLILFPLFATLAYMAVSGNEIF
jgi:hypothetical protein